MTSLHTINKAPSHTHLWESLLASMNDGDQVLLIEDGCYALLDSTLTEQLSEVSEQTCIINSDAEARGLNLEQNKEAIRPASYHDFVTLSAKHDKVVSWT